MFLKLFKLFHHILHILIKFKKSKKLTLFNSIIVDIISDTLILLNDSFYSVFIELLESFLEL